MTPTTITRRQAIPQILAAIENQTLAATDPIGQPSYAHPRGATALNYASVKEAIEAGAPTCYCAIGVLIGHDNAVDLQFGGSAYALAHTLISRGDLIVPEQETDWFIELQNLHDRWVNSYSDRDANRQTFMDHLQ